MCFPCITRSFWKPCKVSEEDGLPQGVFHTPAPCPHPYYEDDSTRREDEVVSQRDAVAHHPNFYFAWNVHADIEPDDHAADMAPRSISDDDSPLLAPPPPPGPLTRMTAYHCTGPSLSPVCLCAEPVPYVVGEQAPTNNGARRLFHCNQCHFPIDASHPIVREDAPQRQQQQPGLYRERTFRNAGGVRRVDPASPFMTYQPLQY